MTASHKVYLVRAGRDGEDEADALDLGMAILGFSEYPALTEAKDYDAVFALVNAATPDIRPRAAANFARQLWAFAVAMQPGDIVVLPRRSTSQVALGRVTGPYQYQPVGSRNRHVRTVEWVRTDVPRTVFGQDLLSSFGALMTVCRIQRNGAEARVAAVLAGNPDPDFLPTPGTPPAPDIDGEAEASAQGQDLALVADEQIVAHIQQRFHGHALAKLVNAVLEADGWTTKLSPPGPDGGVDIFAGWGPFGLDAPHLCVQVKSQNSPADVTVYRTLQGAMQTFKAHQGLVVCWGGFNRAMLNEARNGHFTVRLWDSRDLVAAIYRTYENLPAEIQAELPLKRVWMLVQDGDDA